MKQEKKLAKKKNTTQNITPKSIKICQKCFVENEIEAIKCDGCGGKKFAPEYIKKIEKVTGNTFAQITLPQDSKEQRITLYKWWPGGRTSFNINNIEQYEKIVEVIQTKLLPAIGWRSQSNILQEIAANDGRTSEKDIVTLTKNYPELIRKVLQQIDVTTWEENNYVDLAEILKEISELLSKTDVGFRQAFIEVVHHLPSQGKRAVEDLSELLKTWSLKQLTSISNQVINRIQTLELFKNRILDDKTFEIRGDDSIHRILETAMWIIDERYWLLHSNKTLRTIVGDEIVKVNKGNEKKRPDFVCGSVGEKLIIVELKRPSHKLEIDDLNQLENYLSIIEQKYSGRTFECYLIGNSISDELERKKKYRGSQFKVRTFTDLIDDTEKRYKDYLKALSI
jgi:ribosomal protein L40E